MTAAADKPARGRKRLDLTGHRFGRLVAVKFHARTATRGTLWEFTCDCGTTGHITSQNRVQSGTTKSCGCLKREVSRTSARTTTTATMWRKAYLELTDRKPEATTCKFCEVAFTPLSKDVLYCCDGCRRRASWSKRNAWRKKVAKIGTVNPMKVFERAKWRCEGCGRKLDKEKRGTFGADAPEVDHIMPLSLGGEHSYSNTRCLCRGCNLAKSAKPAGQMWLGLEVSHG